MDELEAGKRYIIHGYKHNHNIHRAWDEAVFIESNSDYFVFGNNHTKVTEADGRTWKTKEPAIIFFYKDSWYNVIGQLKSDGIYYYCNLASPFVVSDGAIKYIDYDLDLRVFPDGSFKILDRGEYKYHKSLMNYSSDIDLILKEELNNLIETVRKKEGPFRPGIINYYNEQYNELKKHVPAS